MMWGRQKGITPEEKWHYQPLAREILSKMARHDVTSNLTEPDMTLIEWLAKEGGPSDNATSAIMECAYRGLLDRHGSPNGEVRSDKELEIRTYPYVPSGRARFARAVLPLFYGKRHFVDVGSGYSDKPLLAHVYGRFDSVTGIELNAFTHSAAVLLLGSLFPEEHITWKKQRSWNRAYTYLLNENAFDVNFKNYDAVYMYMPIADAATMTKLHVHAINTMPVGGRLYEVQHGLFNRRKWDEDAEGWWECRCPDCREGDECTHEGLSFLEYAEEVGAPIKRKIRVSHENHLVEVIK